jgi:hypothetical protein
VGTTGIGARIGSTAANWIEISRMPGSRFMITSGDRCVMSSST